MRFDHAVRTTLCARGLDGFGESIVGDCTARFIIHSCGSEGVEEVVGCRSPFHRFRGQRDRARSSLQPSGVNEWEGGGDEEERACWSSISCSQSCTLGIPPVLVFRCHFTQP